MKPPRLLLLLVFGLCSIPVAAQQPPQTTPPVQRLDDMQRVRATGPGRLKRTSGALVFDSTSRRMLLTTKGESPLEIPYERLAALHFEDTKYPGAGLFSRTHRYITVFHTRDDGETVVEVLRMRAGDAARAAVTTIERQTGHPLTSSLETQSLLGIPIHAAIGTRVNVTRADGSTVKGTIRRLTASSIEIDTAERGMETFTALNLRRIRHPYSPGRDAGRGFLIGALAGGAAGAMFASAFCDGGSNCDIPQAALLFGGLFGAANAGIGVVVGAMHYPINRAYDVYRSPLHAELRGTVSFGPQIGRDRAALLCSFAF